jgi:hypothetical protein
MELITKEELKAKIFTIRGVQVMLDRDLALLYGVQTKALNQAVKRNKERFPEGFCFQLDKNETFELVTNCDRLQSLKHTSSFPNVFTEQGVAMLSSILKSKKAVETNISIMRAFVEIRKVMTQEHYLSQQFQDLKKELEIRLGEQDTQIIDIYNALEELMDEKEDRKNWEKRKKLGYK